MDDLRFNAGFSAVILMVIGLLCAGAAAIGWEHADNIRSFLPILTIPAIILPVLSLALFYNLGRTHG